MRQLTFAVMRDSGGRATLVVYSSLAARMARFEAAQAGRVGQEILTIERLAARLAGGFLDSITTAEIRAALEDVIATENLGEFNGMRELPGLRATLATSLQRAWSSQLDFATLLQSDPHHARFATFAAIETAVLSRLRSCARRPAALLQAALENLARAPKLFGSITIAGHTELDPVWRPLLAALARVMPVVWEAGPRAVPAWLADIESLDIRRTAPETPRRENVSCATPRHEVLEALRWVRDLLSRGRAQPAQIALVAASTDSFTDHVQSLATQAAMRIHHVGGTRTLNSAGGQLLASFAEILRHGANTARIRRYVSLAIECDTRFVNCERDWLTHCPQPDTLQNTKRWLGFLESTTDPTLQPISNLLMPLLRASESDATPLSLGRRFLPAGLHDLWHELLSNGPLAAVAEQLRTHATAVMQGAITSPETDVIFCQAADLAAAPRAYVRIIGLNAKAWPRPASEDPLLPSHIIAREILDPLPRHEADRRDFFTIERTTQIELICSSARRGADGKIVMPSPLCPSSPDVTAQYAMAAASTVIDEADLRFTQPNLALTLPHIRRAQQRAHDWQSAQYLAADGAFSPNHALLKALGGRVESPSSLGTLLLRPMEYLWRYGFHWNMPEFELPTVQLRPQRYGLLMHELLEQTVRRSTGRAEDLGAIVHVVLDELTQKMRSAGYLPPRVLWQASRLQCTSIVVDILTRTFPPLEAMTSYVEVAFGEPRDRAASPSTVPFSPAATVFVRELGLTLRGRIDRLDMSADGRFARLVDYKTGAKPPTKPALTDNVMVQCAMYAYALRTLLPQLTNIEAYGLYTRAISAGAQPVVALPDPPTSIPRVLRYLQIARETFTSGRVLPSRAQVSTDYALCLPARSNWGYLPYKSAAFNAVAPDLCAVWDGTYVDSAA